MEKSGKHSIFYIDEIIRLSVGTVIRRFGKDNTTKMLLAERKVDGCNECFLQCLVKRLLSKCTGRGVIKHGTVNEVIDVTVPEFFGGEYSVAV